MIASIGGRPGHPLLTGRASVASLIGRLPRRVQRMIDLRFSGARTDAEIAAELGMPAEQVAEVLPRALGWLRAAMLSDMPPSWSDDEPAGLPGISVQMRETGSGLTVRITGEIDRDVCDRLRHRLRCAITLAGDGLLTLDLTGVPLLDAAGTGVLCEALRAAGLSQVRVRVQGIQPQVAVVLNAAGVNLPTGW